MTRRLDPQPVTLQGTHVRLEPLARRHAEDLFEVGKDETIWPYMPRPALQSVQDAQAMIDQALEAAAGGSQIPLAIIEQTSGKGVGSTRYLDIRRNDRGLEIGWTWIGTAYQRTVVNTECKYLLLRHAFENLGAVRVQLKTDLRNVRSQRAIERPGAVREGVLRRQIVLSDGFIRDTATPASLTASGPRSSAASRVCWGRGFTFYCTAISCYESVRPSWKGEWQWLVRCSARIIALT